MGGLTHDHVIDGCGVPEAGIVTCLPAKRVFIWIIFSLLLLEGMTWAAGDYLTDAERNWLNDHPVIRLGVGVAFPPFQWVEMEDGQYQFRGLAADYVRLLEKELGVRMDIVYGITFGDAIEKGKAREIDFFPCIAENVQRREFLRFTPYLNYPLVIVTRENNPWISSIEDLRGRTIAIVPSLVVYSMLRENYSHLNLKYYKVNTLGENLEAVSLGNADACLINLAATSSLIQQKGLTNLRVSATVNWDQYVLSMGVRSDWPEFHRIIGKALDHIPQQTKNDIAEKWIRVKMPTGINPERLIRWGLAIGSCVMALFLLFFFWNRRLQKEIVERRRAEAHTRDSESRYRALFESAHDAICVMDGFSFVDCNLKGLELFGFESKSDLKGRTLIDVLIEDPEERQRTEVVGGDVLTRVMSGIPLSFEWVFQRKDGLTLHTHISLNRIVIQDEYRILANIRNISDQQAILKEKQDLEDQLRQARKMEAIGTLSGGIAHDFNNILSIVLGNVELAIKTVSSNHEVQNYLSEIRTAGVRAADVVNQLLSFSRKSERMKKPVDVDNIVDECIRLMRATLPSSVQIRRADKGTSAVVLGDPTQIQQVLINLCTNSAHAMERDGGVLEIAVDMIQHETASDDAVQVEGLERPCVRLSVRDTGHGIESEIMDRIFDPYFTTKEMGKGTGMGLSVVHGIVQDHDGVISVSSEPGKGCTVEVMLPLVGMGAATGSFRLSELPGGSETIMVVDDETTLVGAMCDTLAYFGYRVHGETDPKKALERFRKDPVDIDLVITDMTMPDMSGQKLVQKMRDIRSDIPVILQTGYNIKFDPGIVEIQYFLEKPVLQDVLALAVRNVLDNQSR